MRAKHFLAAVVAGAALIGTACGRELEDANVATIDLSEEQQAALRASRALSKEGSPGSVVMTFIQDLRDAAGPAVFPVYDPRIPERVGKGNVLGALQVITDSVKELQPVVVRRRKTQAGELVVVRFLRADGIDSRHSYLLRHDGRRWLIVYDSFLAEALQTYVTNQKSRDPAAPSLEATRAARRALSELRVAALPPASRERAPGGQATSPSAAEAP